MSSPSTVAAAAGILASASTAGGIAGLSLFSMPALLNPWTKPPTDVLLKQWYVIFHRGKMLPAAAMLATVDFAYLGWRSYVQGLEWRGYAGAAGLNLGLMPITFIFVFPINDVLSAAAFSKKEKSISDDEARRLIQKWSNLNAIRAFLPLAGAALAFWALVG